MGTQKTPVEKGWVLAVDSSSEEGSLALFFEEQIVTQNTFAMSRASQQLASPLHETLKSLPPGTPLQTILMGTGPGSYTGIKVGISLAQGLSIAFGCKLVPLPSLLAIEKQKRLIIGDARRGEFWAIAFTEKKKLSKTSFFKKEELTNYIQEKIHAKETLYTLENIEKFAEFPQKIQSRIINFTPKAEKLAQNWFHMEELSKQEFMEQPIQPFYLRSPHITKPKK